MTHEEQQATSNAHEIIVVQKLIDENKVLVLQIGLIIESSFTNSITPTSLVADLPLASIHHRPINDYGRFSKLLSAICVLLV
jgi:hypothetical protein